MREIGKDSKLHEYRHGKAKGFIDQLDLYDGWYWNYCQRSRCVAVPTIWSSDVSNNRLSSRRLALPNGRAPRVFAYPHLSSLCKHSAIALVRIRADESTKEPAEVAYPGTLDRLKANF